MSMRLATLFDAGLTAAAVAVSALIVGVGGANADPQDAQAQLMSLLPSGYPSGACHPSQRTLHRALVSVTCGPNVNTNGPVESRYGLYSDESSMNDAFNDFAEDTAAITAHSCFSGGSPGPDTWYHGTDPTDIAGKILCGYNSDNVPVVIWSNNTDLVLGVAIGGPQGPSIDQLYSWWKGIGLSG